MSLPLNTQSLSLSFRCFFSRDRSTIEIKQVQLDRNTSLRKAENISGRPMCALIERMRHRAYEAQTLHGRCNDKKEIFHGINLKFESVSSCAIRRDVRDFDCAGGAYTSLHPLIARALLGTGLEHLKNKTILLFCSVLSLDFIFAAFPDAI